MISAGRLKYRATIEELRNVQSAFGEPSQEWKAVATVWAGIAPLSGREFLQSQQMNSEITARIFMRYIDGINAGMRVRARGRVYNIKAVLNNQERDRELILMCGEGVNDG